jgi:histidinol-phosphate/aromatic aminotransferase/cobyric acid decarboxylase-like protein
VRTVTPAGHGGDGVARALARGLDPNTILDLSASLHPAAPELASVAAAALGELGRYPDPTRATDALAEVLGVESDRLLLTNGGAEAIALLAGHLRCGSVVDPDFSLYARHLEHVDPAAPRWRSNPNNPMGALAAEDERAAVWDEAFYPTATGRWTRGDDAWRLGSLTKLWACPGLRLGYLIAPHADALVPVADRQPRWSVNGLALACVEPLLERTDLAVMHRSLVALRSQLVDLLRSHGYDARGTDAAWTLVHEGGDLADRLEADGTFVRRCESFGLPGVVRIAVPDADGLARLERTLDRLPAVP